MRGSKIGKPWKRDVGNASRRSGVRDCIGSVLVVVLFLGTSPARADEDADRRAAATQVLDELHSADMVSGFLPTIIGQIRTNLTHNDPTLLKQFDALEPELRAKAEATRPALMAKLVDVYAHTFSLDDLRDMLAYYKSPVGQRIIAAQGTINHDMLAAARDWGMGVAQALARNAAAELQGTPKPATDTP